MQKKILYKGSITGIIQLFVSTLLTFITIRFFILQLGSEKYGIYSVISVIGNLNIFTNLGLYISLIKFISEQGKNEESNYDIIVTIIILTFILIPFTLIMYLYRKTILVTFFSIPSIFVNESVNLFNYLLISNVIVLIGQVFTAVIDASQKVYITNLLQIFYNFLYWIGILISLFIYNSLYAIGFPILMASLIWFIISFIIFYKIWGRIYFKGILGNFLRITKKQLSYSFKIYFTNIMGFFYEPFTKLLISKYLGLYEVGFFDIALKIKTQLWSLIGKATSPLLPFIAKMRDERQIGSIVNDLEQKIFYIILPAVSIMFVCTYSFINFWLGLEVNIISISVISIVNSYLIFSSTVLPNYLYFMSKRPNITIIIQASNVMINIIIFFVLLNIIGYYSVIISFSTAIIVSFLISLYYQNKYLKKHIFVHKGVLFKYIFILIIVTIIGYISGYFIRYDVIKIIISSFAIIISTVLLYKYLNVFNMEDAQRYFDGNELIKDIFIKLLILKK